MPKWVRRARQFRHSSADLTYTTSSTLAVVFFAVYHANPRLSGDLGAPFELRTWFCAVSQCDRSPHRGPPDTLLAHRPRRARLYLYSSEEIRSLLRATLAWSGWAKLRPWTYYCLFGLLSVSGLRLGEACNLQFSDVELETGVLTIRGAKFGKSRLVHASTCQVLAEYLARRRRHWAGWSVSSYVFVTDRGNRLDIGDIRRTFHAVSRQIGLRDFMSIGGVVNAVKDVLPEGPRWIRPRR